MLLSRKRGQRIVIGDEITVEIVAIDGATVRVGVTAPRDVTVDREEVTARKRAEKEARRKA